MRNLETHLRIITLKRRTSVVLRAGASGFSFPRYVALKSFHGIKISWGDVVPPDRILKSYS